MFGDKSNPVMTIAVKHTVMHFSLCQTSGSSAPIYILTLEHCYIFISFFLKIPDTLCIAQAGGMQVSGITCTKEATMGIL